MQFLYEVTFSNINPQIPIFFRNFDRPFTPRTWLGLAWNFGKTRFRRFPTFHFSTPKNIFRQFFFFRNDFFQKSGVLEELWISDRHWQIPRQKLLPVVCLFLGRVPWRRGKSGTNCFWPWLSTKIDFNHVVSWSYAIMTQNHGCFHKSGVLEELWISEHHWQIPRQKLLPVVRLFLGRVPWRRGKSGTNCFWSGFWTENDFNLFVLWCYDNIIWRYYDSLLSW